MSQKINPINLRLGVTQVWDLTLQNYGKLYKNYSLILHKQFQISQFLTSVFNLHKFLMGQKRFQYFNNRILIKVYYSNLAQIPSLNNLFLSRISKLATQWATVKILFRFYFKPQWFSSIDLISNYTQYLLKQKTSPNKLLWNLCYFLENQLDSKKILYSTFGPIETSLKGFKIRLVGRFDNSRNQMAKSIEQSVGSLPLMHLQSHVEFLNTEVYTKLGTCGLQIWLFYKIH